MRKLMPSSTHPVHQRGSLLFLHHIVVSPQRHNDGIVAIAVAVVVLINA